MHFTAFVTSSSSRSAIADGSYRRHWVRLRFGDGRIGFDAERTGSSERQAGSSWQSPRASGPLGPSSGSKYVAFALPERLVGVLREVCLKPWHPDSAACSVTHRCTTVSAARLAVLAQTHLAPEGVRWT